MTAEQIARIERVCIEIPEGAAFSAGAMLQMCAEVRRMRSTIADLLLLIDRLGSATLHEAARDVVQRTVKAGH